MMQTATVSIPTNSSPTLPSETAYSAMSSSIHVGLHQVAMWADKFPLDSYYLEIEFSQPV